ncbi:MAG: hypothetical protein JXA18_00915 [Chitinispirillaceae bacterium]|nr:hypothetical protein [Chitinispirillaceae bacterium]
MKLTLLLVGMILPLTIFAAENGGDTLPFTFKSGDTARADAVNENFTYLLQVIRQAESRIDSLADVSEMLVDSIAELRSIKEEMTKIDSLADVTQSLSDSMVKIKNTVHLPIGTIIGSMLNPEKFRQFFPGDSTLWILADSSTASAEFFAATGKSNIPDLRGVFLRGINSDRSGTLSDPDGEREAGSSQADAFKSHNHSRMQFVSGATNSGTWGVLDNTDRGHSTTSSSSTGGAETRPRNVAVYWYIKVK